MYQYLAIDQFGNKVFIEKYPRKELIDYVGKSNVSKMYVDNKDGKTYHIGYVVSNHWFTVLGLEGNIFRNSA